MATTASMEITKRTVTTITEVENLDGSETGEKSCDVRVQARLSGGEVYDLEVVEDPRTLYAEHRPMLSISHRNRYLDSLEKRTEPFTIPVAVLRGMLALLDGEPARDTDDRDGDEADGPIYDEA